MKTIQPGHDVISLFGMATKNRALSEKTTNNGLVISLVSAFFIILAVSLILSVSTKILGPTSNTIAAQSVTDEKVAFEPGSFVSNEISRGYLGFYR